MKTLITVFLMAFSLNIYAFGFKGLEVGDVSSWEGVGNALNIQCRDAENNWIICYGDTTIVGGKAVSMVELSAQRIIESITVKFESEDFDKIFESLQSKYGKPSAVNKSTLSNAMGASFEQVSVIWSNKKNQSMNLRKYGSTITNGMLMIRTDDAMKKSKQESQKEQSDI